MKNYDRNARLMYDPTQLKGYRITPDGKGIEVNRFGLRYSESFAISGIPRVGHTNDLVVTKRRLRDDSIEVWEWMERVGIDIHLSGGHGAHVLVGLSDDDFALFKLKWL